MSDELKRMQELAGVPVNEEKESLNENQIGGIVGIGAIHTPKREKSDYEMAFEHFMNEERKLEMDPGEITGTDIDDIEISSPPDFGDDKITGTDIDDIEISSPPDFGDDKITGTYLEEKEADEVGKLKSYLEGTGKNALLQINKTEELKDVLIAIKAGMGENLQKNPSVNKGFELMMNRL